LTSSKLFFSSLSVPGYRPKCYDALELSYTFNCIAFFFPPLLRVNVSTLPCPLPFPRAGARPLCAGSLLREPSSPSSPRSARGPPFIPLNAFYHSMPFLLVPLWNGFLIIALVFKSVMFIPVKTRCKEPLAHFSIFAFLSFSESRPLSVFASHLPWLFPPLMSFRFVRSLLCPTSP